MFLSLCNNSLTSERPLLWLPVAQFESSFAAHLFFLCVNRQNSLAGRLQDDLWSIVKIFLLLSCRPSCSFWQFLKRFILFIFIFLAGHHQLGFYYFREGFLILFLNCSRYRCKFCSYALCLLIIIIKLIT